jgi:hypothetical protein
VTANFGTQSLLEADNSPVVQTYTFNLVAESTDGAAFNSREASANRPELVIETT